MHRDPTLSHVLVLVSVLVILTAAVLVALTALWMWVRMSLRLAMARLLNALARQERTLAVLLERSGQVGDSPRDPDGPEPAADPLARPRPSVHRCDPAQAEAIGGPTLIAVPSLTAASLADSDPDSASAAEATSAASAELARRFGAIWDLADAGEPAEAIARATGQPVGQVELILGLRRQLGTTTATATATIATPSGPPGGRPFPPFSGPSEPRR